MMLRLVNATEKKFRADVTAVQVSFPRRLAGSFAIGICILANLANLSEFGSTPQKLAVAKP